MTRRFLVVNAALTLSLLPTPGTVGRAFAQEPPVTTFRSSIDVVSVSAVVRDRKGRFVGNLERKDFIVAEAGQVRPILDFRAQADGPVKLAMLFDISGSMRVGTKAVDARQAARHVFGSLRPGDEAALFSFDTRLDRVTPFTSDLASLDAALDHVQSPLRTDIAVRCHRRHGEAGVGRRTRQRSRSAEKCRRRPDRRHRHAEPPDVGTGLDPRQQHRHPRLHRRRRCDD